MMKKIMTLLLIFFMPLLLCGNKDQQAKPANPEPVNEALENAEKLVEMLKNVEKLSYDEKVKLNEMLKNAEKLSYDEKVKLNSEISRHNEKVRRHYFQILLEKWQKNPDWQEIVVQGKRTRGDFKYFREVIKEHYNVDPRSNMVKTGAGEKWYDIMYVYDLPDNEQIWVLISSINGNVLAMQKEKASLDKARLEYVEMTTKEDFKRAEEDRQKQIKREKDIQDSIYYKKLLQKWELDSILCPFPDRSMSGVLNNYEDIDYATAAAISRKAAAECYASEMTFIEARLFGDNNEHWLAYVFPTINDIKEQEYCYSNLVEYHKGNSSSLKCTTKIFIVLISRKNGQVLSMLETFVMKSALY
jgi:hypothetical protein